MKVTPWRAAATALAIGGFCAALISMVRAGLGDATAVLAGPLFTLPLCSLGEWLVHAQLYHRGVPGLLKLREIHVAGHHASLFPPSHYFQREGHPFMSIRAPLRPFRMAPTLFDSLLTEYGQVALHFAAGIALVLLPAWLLTHDRAFFLSCLGALLAISWLLAEVHGAIHTPRQRWLERQAWFLWLDRHHYTHHVDLSANVNFMLPLCDFLLGTRKAALTAAEAARHPSYQEARAP